MDGRQCIYSCFQPINFPANDQTKSDTIYLRQHFAGNSSRAFFWIIYIYIIKAFCKEKAAGKNKLSCNGTNVDQYL